MTTTSDVRAMKRIISKQEDALASMSASMQIIHGKCVDARKWAEQEGWKLNSKLQEIEGIASQALVRESGKRKEIKAIKRGDVIADRIDNYGDN